MADHKALYAAASEALKKKGVRISIGGCGCCGSPFVKLEIDGQVIVMDEDNFNLDMFEDDSQAVENNN
ncbi:MAG TPA: hypothetical protein PK735_12525, partial [Flavobacteriales bacterium]|nr:hypothetical protein [Flavobacteriales bacterium]